MGSVLIFVSISILLLSSKISCRGFQEINYNNNLGGGVDGEDDEFGSRLSKGEHIMKPNLKYVTRGRMNDEYKIVGKDVNADLIAKFKSSLGNLQNNKRQSEKEKDTHIERALNRRSGPTKTTSESQSPISPSQSMEQSPFLFSFHGIENDDMICEPARIIPIFYGCNSSSAPWFGYNTYNINKFLNDLGTQSFWWWMVQQYYNPNFPFPYQTTPASSLGYVSQFIVQDTVLMCDYPFGMDVTSEDIQTKIVRHAMYRYNAGTGGRNDIYVIIPDASVTFDGACTEFCGYHYSYGDRKRVFNVVMVANPFYCLNQFGDFHMCASTLLKPDGQGSVNDNVETDAQVNIIAHEIAEAITDPYGTGWYSVDPPEYAGMEIADPCAWRFKDVMEGYGGYFNEPMGDGVYLIQSIMPGSCPTAGFGLSICSSSIDWIEFEGEFGCFCSNFEFFC
jgi:hypothetical protein